MTLDSPRVAFYFVETHAHLILTRGSNRVQASPGRLNGFHSVLFYLVLFIYHSLLFSQNLTITELHRNPYGGETALCAGASHEFVEIANFCTDTFFTDNFFISDGNESDTVVPFGLNLQGHDSCITDQHFIAPGQIALILDSDYQKAVEKQGCNLPIKGGTVLFRCSDAELGNGLTDDDGLLLYKGTRSRIESVVCLISDNPLESESSTFGKLVFSEPKNIEGYSIVATSFLFEKSNYDICNISPGWLEQMQKGWVVEWKFGSYNTGQQDIACTLACVYTKADLQTDKFYWSLEKTGTQIRSGGLVLENKRDELVISLKADTVDYRFSIDNTQWLIDLSSLLTPHNPIKINEIFPFGNQDETEWIELVNTASMSINLKNWSFGNYEDTVVIHKSEFVLNPGAFVIIAKSKTLLQQIYPVVGPIIQPPAWHTLNNYGDTLCIFDANGGISDMVCYKNSWFANTNKAIERVNCSRDGCDSTNWSLSNQGGTPGYPNDAIFWRNISNTQMEIGPVPFTPDNDGRNDLLCIKIAVPASQSVRLCIYGFDGKVVRAFDGPLQKQYFWDGKGDNGRAARCGPFFVVAEVTTSKGVTLLRKKGILWR